MKIPYNSHHAPSHSGDIHSLNNPFHKRKPITTRSKRLGAPTGKRSRPETPLLKWKINDQAHANSSSLAPSVPRTYRNSDNNKNRTHVAVSARRLAAGLWRLHMPEMDMNGCRRTEDRLGLQHGIGHVGLPFHGHPNGTTHGYDLKNISQSPRSISGTKSGHFCEPEPPFQFSNTEMEGATKWDPLCLKTSNVAQHIYSQMKLLDHKVSAVSAVSALEAELEQARSRIQELETERCSSKKKLEHYLKKVSEERVQWRSREHEKIRAYIDDIKSELNRERKSRQRIEIVNSRLVNELADVKLSAKRYKQDYEKERKARELIEEVCDELAKEIGEDKAEVEALKRESFKFREEAEEERRMLQMAEVWREERVQMKLIDAKIALEEKYSQMNKLVADLESLIKSRGMDPNSKEMREAQSLQRASAAMNIQDIKGFSYEPPNSVDIFDIFEDANFGEPNERDIEPCVSHSSASHASNIHKVSLEANVVSKDGIKRHSDVFMDDNGDIEGEESGWETVSHAEDQGSSYSPEGSDKSLSRNNREINVSRRSVLEWEQNAGEETPITEISEVCSIPTKQSKKLSSIARLWRSGLNNGDNYNNISMEGMNGRISNEKLSKVGIMSPDHGLGKGGLSPQDLLYQLSSPESGNPQSHRGMKGCIPRNTLKSSLKSKLLEARMESQKFQLRHVLKQKY
ncbi:hypothetical protein TanjilG_29647 [Lupinus angustifolius]|uniref:Uncharacterized protein n=1 Tax=Lupinus angustifolius TaxID=3871 RepID=A0A4P1R6C5_LUPAN|nr:PREDICTED: uncharacterized protein LOC109361029 [Lupinus angustifolius]XP_019461862.1 PREDICTED: uncharacterized protein LOC109361029 [Lupinus angustifolius]OIW02871.1 hypothetical protein TanjilG_29647 [Lupinus angustifolius]